LDPNAWPKSRNGRKIHRSNTFKLSILQENKWEVGQTFKATLLTPSNIPPPRYGEFYHSSDIRSIRFKHTRIIRFFGLFKNTAQNTQSGKGYANNHYQAAKTVVC
jgi:hypothetical protein